MSRRLSNVQSQRFARPSVWLLTDSRPGNKTQLEGVARILGVDAPVRILDFNRFAEWPPVVLGATLRTLTRASRKTLAPPYPDLVIGVGSPCAPVARWIGRASGGRTKVTLFGRKTPASCADLTIGCPHMGHWPHERRLELTLPPTKVSTEGLREIRRWRANPLEGLRSPAVVFLVGGNTGRHNRLTPAYAAMMADEAASATERIGGELAIVTSRRTPQDAADAMRAAAPTARFFEWKPNDPANPYLALLAHADLVMVTGESESMLGEAVAARIPLTIFPMAPRVVTRSHRRKIAIFDRALRAGWLGAVCRKLVLEALALPPRNFDLLHERIERNGWGRRFSGELNREPPQPNHEAEILLSRLMRLLEERPQENSAFLTSDSGMHSAT